MADEPTNAPDQPGFRDPGGDRATGGPDGRAPWAARHHRTARAV
ncbi:hypothetical protein [Streptomyces bohaiensis]|nr:hypothetical protein [Streptomyces bohaiensis]